ncbi:hypothetical protein DQ384_32780 [Sphaerisporangium album]|uniref:Uncharacterized protein n=1 Tax=Sphaerisporangium album TaxID=509200 RepID=A0A367F2D6_9ACTN|nr:hypothetical protein DQ384_32780 [Sphaerisporangium album]
MCRLVGSGGAAGVPGRAVAEVCQVAGSGGPTGAFGEAGALLGTPEAEVCRLVGSPSAFGSPGSGEVDVRQADGSGEPVGGCVELLERPEIAEMAGVSGSPGVAEPPEAEICRFVGLDEPAPPGQGSITGSPRRASDAAALVESAGEAGVVGGAGRSVCAEGHGGVWGVRDDGVAWAG